MDGIVGTEHVSPYNLELMHQTPNAALYVRCPSCNCQGALSCPADRGSRALQRCLLLLDGVDRPGGRPDPTQIARLNTDDRSNVLASALRGADERHGEHCDRYSINAQRFIQAP